MFVGDVVGFFESDGALLQREGVVVVDVGNFEGHFDDTVAVLGVVLGGGGFGGDAAREDEGDSAGFQDVFGVLAKALLRSAVRDALHAEGGGVIVSGLFGVADIETEVVPPFDGKVVLADVVLDSTHELGFGDGQIGHGRLLAPGRSFRFGTTRDLV